MKSTKSQYEIWEANQRAREAGKRYCVKCDTVKEAVDFNPSDRERLGAYCRACKQKYNRDRYLAKGHLESPSKHRSETYGLSEEQYQQLMADQGHRCGSCEIELTALHRRKVHVDHDHATGRVRGILCMWCNVMLGGARDNPDSLRGAIQYLQRTRS